LGTGFDEAFLHEVRERNDIVSVVGDYVALRKAGTTYKGLCPFHAEKTPSFHVRPDRQFFYCFGCQTGGDVLSFVREVNGYSFIEAVRHLAERAGLQMPERSTGPGFSGAGGSEERGRKPGQASRQTRDTLYAINKVALKFFTETLQTLEGAAARDYLERRGISRDTATRFGLGVAPDRWDGLVETLAREGADVRLAESLGLVVKKTSGHGYYDRFRNRLMFPIRSVAGDVLGFSGRTLGSDPEAAKYVNSPESPIYQKGESVYGLFEARQAMRKADRALIVEGNVDLVTLSQAGLGEVVAPLGTALTPMQCRLIKRFVPQAVALYDGDGAGREAGKKAAAMALAEGLALSVASLPDKEDPDSYVRKHGREALDRLLAAARPAWEFLVGDAIDETNAMNSAQGKKLAVEKLAPVLSGLSSPEERELYVRQLGETLGLDVRLVADMARAGVRRAPEVEQAVAVVETESELPASDLKLLELLVLVPDARALYFGRDVETLLTDARSRQVAELIAECEGDLAETLSKIPAGPVKGQLLRRLADAPVPTDGVGAFQKMLKTLRHDAIERQLDALRRDERRASLDNDDDAQLLLAVQKAKLQKQREDLLKALRD
jgi:DNA primase